MGAHLGDLICYNAHESAMIQDTTMNLPVRFPSETEVILEDVARFRALSAADRIRTIRNMLADGAFVMSKSANAGWAKRCFDEQEEVAQRNIRDFIVRHAS